MDSHPIVVPVRFSGGGLALQSTTSRMSAEAAFVRSIVSPKEGVQMTVVLFLPGERRLELPDGEPPARTKAEVVQRTTPEEARASGRAAGAGLQFIGGDDEFRRRLDACLEKLLK